MTFSIAIRCAETGHFGVAGTTSSIAVGARCLFVEAGVGAVITQHRTDPRLGQQGLALMRQGCTAPEALSVLALRAPGVEWRELALVDTAGRTAARQGLNQEPLFAEAQAEGIVAVGNILRDTRVPLAMVEAAQDTEGRPLAERLLAALWVGLGAGGEIYPLKSAALQVGDHPGFSSVDLRVDMSEDPLADLAALWSAYAPQQATFVERVLDPDKGGRATCSADILAFEGAQL